MPLEIEHIIPRKHHGDDSPNNLTLACFPCNCHKGANLTGIDPESGNVTRLFHRRRDTWADHFQRQDQVIVGLSDIGRVTIDVLRLNAPEALRLREAIAE